MDSTYKDHSITEDTPLHQTQRLDSMSGLSLLHKASYKYIVLKCISISFWLPIERLQNVVMVSAYILPFSDGFRDNLYKVL
jgi:hypothetical protein